MVKTKCISWIGNKEKGKPCGGELGFLGYNILYKDGQEIINNSYKCLRCYAVMGVPTDYHLCNKRGIIFEAKQMNDVVDRTCDTCPLAPSAPLANTPASLLPPYRRCIHYSRMLQKSEIMLDNPVRMKTTFGDHFLASKKVKLRRA